MTESQKLMGMIVEESLTDNRVLNGLHFTDVRITGAERPEDRWHIYTVVVSHEDVTHLQSKLRRGTWYMHFWDEAIIVAVFPDRIFEMQRQDKGTWKSAIDYGMALGIPLEQLDFLTT